MLRRTLLIITLVKQFTRYKYTSQESLINSLKVVCHGHFFFNECLISRTKILEIFSQRSLNHRTLAIFISISYLSEVQLTLNKNACTYHVPLWSIWLKIVSTYSDLCRAPSLFVSKWLNRSCWSWLSELVYFVYSTKVSCPSAINSKRTYV